MWSEYGKEAFERARRENKLVLLDGAAEWCHWCHVMEATSSHDPRVRKILDESFVTIKVDVDGRPDLEERYSDWGWPAAVLFALDAQARKNVVLTLPKQTKIIDPVWGGIYQYSAASDWEHPHFEKLATFHAAGRTTRRPSRSPVMRSTGTAPLHCART